VRGRGTRAADWSRRATNPEHVLLEDNGMKKALMAVVAAALLAATGTAGATTSTTFWTPATTYTQPFLVPHLTLDTYFGERGDAPLTTGLTMGVLPFEKLQGEIGFDLFFPAPAGFGTGDVLALNGRISVPEGAFGAYVPGVSVGIQGVGFEKDVSDLNMLHATVGKTLPVIGTVAVGGYYGLNDKLLVDETGAPVDQGGFMASWVSPEIKIGKPGIDKIFVMADAMTGDHAFGAVGGGLGIYFTPSIALLTGPVLFLNSDLAEGLYGNDMLWSMQIDVDMDLFKK
jgi:hypothetical protein